MATFVAWLDGLIVRERVRVYAVTFLVLGAALLLLDVVLGRGLITLSGQAVLPDYLAHWTGGRLLLDGDVRDLYDPTVQHAVQSSVTGGSPPLSWFISPPFAAAAYAPLALLPYPVSAAAWTCVSIGLLVASMVLLRPMLPRLGDRDWTLTVVVVAASQPVLEVLGAGQDSALSVFLWVCATRLLASDRDVAAGAVLALGLYKPQLFVLAPLVLVLQRRGRATASWAVTACLLALASWVVAGTSGLTQWLAVPFDPLYRAGLQAGLSWKMQGLPSLAESLVPSGLASAALVLGLVLAAGLLVAFVSAVLRAPRASVMPVWSLTALTTVVVSPHAFTYDLVLAVPALLHVLDREDSRTTRLSLLALFVLGWTASARHVVAGLLPWPLSVVGAAWVAVPLAVLWFLSWRECWAATPAPGIAVPAEQRPAPGHAD